MKLAFKMECYAKHADEYINAHKNVDDLLEVEFKKARVQEYTIWYDVETNILFAFVEVEDLDQWNKIDQTIACKEWWKKMELLMPTNPDGSPKTKDLKKIYDYKGE